MLINIDKTKLMLIASRQKRNSLTDTDLKLTYNNLELNISTNGVYVDQNFAWNNHFQHVSKKILTYLVIISNSNIFNCPT